MSKIDRSPESSAVHCTAADVYSVDECSLPLVFKSGTIQYAENVLYSARAHFSDIMTISISNLERHSRDHLLRKGISKNLKGNSYWL